MSLASCEGCKLAQVGVLGVSLPCAFTVGVGRSGSYILPVNPLMAIPHSDPTRQSPFPEHFQCRMRCWLSGPRALQNETCQEEVFFGFVFVFFFLISATNPTGLAHMLTWTPSLGPCL